MPNWATRENFAQFIVAYISSRILDDERILKSRAFVDSIDFDNLSFDVEALESVWKDCSTRKGDFEWSFDVDVLSEFRTVRPRTNARLS